jgi:hypothetical protein
MQNREEQGLSMSKHGRHGSTSSCTFMNKIVLKLEKYMDRIFQLYPNLAPSPIGMQPYNFWQTLVSRGKICQKL